MTKAMGFKQAQYRDTKVEKRTRRIMVATALVFIIPSILSAIVLVNNNNFDRRATAFVQANKSIQNAIIYDYTSSHEKGDKIELYLSGEKLDEEQTAALFASANEYGIKEEQVAINENKSAKSLIVSDIVNDIYANNERQLMAKKKEVEALRNELNEYKRDSIPCLQIAKELAGFYPSVKSIGISRGSSVTADSLTVRKTTFVNAKASRRFKADEEEKLLRWLKIRLGSEDVELLVTFVK